MRTFPDELARVTMKAKSMGQRGEKRDSEGATRYAPKKNTFIHVLTTTPETNRTTTRDEEGHTPSSSYLPFRHGEGGMPSIVPSRHDEEGMPLLVVLLPSRYGRGGVRPSTSCCLCHSDTTRRVHPFSSYRSCYFNTPGWGIPFQCWERTPPSPLPNFPPPCAPPFWRWGSSLTPNFPH